LNYLTNAVTLSVMVTGDFNHDGLVNSADYVVWRKNNGSVADYNVWRANFGAVLGTGAGAGFGSSSGPNVPEPTGIVLSIIAATFLGFWRPRRS
jgi:hypothetical protein